jgi:hypothetical protein
MNRKKRVLIAFSSPKYERLFQIINEREYDIIEIVYPKPFNLRTKLAKIAARLLEKSYTHIVLKEFDTQSIDGLMKYLFERYHYYYAINSYNVEFALTGSKKQTIVSSILSTILKVSKCWYIKPSSWDTKRFSIGVSETSYFEIENNS